MVNVAILGYGTIGSGVYKVINDNNSHVSRRAGEDIKVKYVLDLRDFPGDPVEDILVHDFDTILNDDEVDIVVEAMGGVEPAHTFEVKALKAGKSVCTSNKEVVAKWGFELLQLVKLLLSIRTSCSVITVLRFSSVFHRHSFLWS